MLMKSKSNIATFLDPTEFHNNYMLQNVLYSAEQRKGNTGLEQHEGDLIGTYFFSFLHKEIIYRTCRCNTHPGATNGLTNSSIFHLVLLFRNNVIHTSSFSA